MTELQGSGTGDMYVEFRLKRRSSLPNDGKLLREFAEESGESVIILSQKGGLPGQGSVGRKRRLVQERPDEGSSTGPGLPLCSFACHRSSTDRHLLTAIERARVP